MMCAHTIAFSGAHEAVFESASVRTYACIPIEEKGSAWLSGSQDCVQGDGQNEVMEVERKSTEHTQTHTGARTTTSPATLFSALKLPPLSKRERGEHTNCAPMSAATEPPPGMERCFVLHRPPVCVDTCVCVCV